MKRFLSMVLVLLLLAVSCAAVPTASDAEGAEEEILVRDYMESPETFSSPFYLFRAGENAISHGLDPKAALEQMYGLAAARDAEDLFLYFCENIAAQDSESYQKMQDYLEQHGRVYGVPYWANEEDGSKWLDWSVYETPSVPEEMKAALADSSAQYCTEPVFWAESDFRDFFGTPFAQFKPSKARPAYICAVVKDSTLSSPNVSWKSENPRSLFHDLNEFLRDVELPGVLTGNPQLASSFLVVEVTWPVRGQYEGGITGYNCKVSLSLVNAADHKAAAQLEYTEILPNRISRWHDGIAEPDFPNWYGIDEGKREGFLSSVRKLLDGQRSVAASARRINALNAEKVLNGILLQQSEKLSGAWHKAICEAGAQEVVLEGDTLTFRLKGYQPDLKALGPYAKAEDKAGWLASALENAQAYSVEVSMQLQDGQPSNKGLNDLRNKVNQAASAAQGAFSNQDMTKALKDFFFPAPLDAAPKAAGELAEPADRFVDWVHAQDGLFPDAPPAACAALFYAQKNQAMNWSGGPHAMVMTCTGVSAGGLLQDSAKAVLDGLAFQTAEERPDPAEFDRLLALRLAEDAFTAFRRTNNRYTVTVDVDQLAEGKLPSDYTDYLAAFDWNGAFGSLQETAAMLPDIAAIPMPKRGLLSGANKGTTINFRIDAGSGDTYIIMKNVNSGEVAVSCFCDPGKQVTVHVPSGEYEIVWGSGPYWYGEPLLFSRLGHYSKSETVTIEGAQYYHTFTLVASQDGDVGIYDADPSDFR